MKLTMQNTHRLLIVATLAILCAGTFTVGTQSATVPNLSGKWKLNHERSDDARQKLDNALPTRNVVDRRGRDVGQNADPRDTDREQARRRIEAIIDASEMLDITQDEKEVKVVEGDLRERKFYTDGRPSQRQDQRGNLVTVRAHWTGQRLVVDTKLADGGRFSESYSLVPKSEQLMVTLTSTDPRLRQPLVLHRIYEAVPR
jgi:hypothetical protein